MTTEPVHLVYTGVSGTNVHTDIGHGWVIFIHRKVGVDVGVIIHLDDGRTAYATLGAFHGTHTRELEPGTRIITRDEFDDITGISAIRREMGWVD